MASLWNTSVRLLILSMKRSQAALRSRSSLASRYLFQIRNATYIFRGSLLRYFPWTNSLAVCSSSGCFQRLDWRACRSGESPYKFQSLSVPRSKFTKKVPSGRVISQSASVFWFPFSQKRICCSSPIKIRSFIFFLSGVRTNKILSKHGSCRINF